MFISIEFQSYIFALLHRNYELSTTVGLTGFDIDPVLLAAFVPIKNYSNAEAPSGYKDKILSDNKNKSGIYM